MLIAALQVAFQQRAVVLNGASIRINHALQQYNQLFKHMTIKAPATDLPAYIFVRAKEKISDLEINGDFGAATETGLVWNQPELRVFSLIMEMRAGPTAVFYVARWAQRIILYSSYIDVQKAVISLDSFVYFSITQGSLIAAYLQHQGTPYANMIRGDAFFTGGERLNAAPNAYEEPCSKCYLASMGRSCSKCMPSTFHDETMSCQCQYRNFKYLDYHDYCQGDAERIYATVDEIVQGVTNSYYSVCQNNYAFKVDYNEQYHNATRISFFKDDNCGLNNIFLSGEIETYSLIPFENEVAGVVMVKTTNMANTTINLNITSRQNKLKSMTLFARNATGSVTIQNLIVSGFVYDASSVITNRTDIRMCILFHYIQNTTLIIDGLMIHNAHVESMYNGTYNSLGIGVATSCILKFSNIYIGDSPDELVNPLLSFDYNQQFTSTVNCSDKMNNEMALEVLMYSKIPQQFESKKCYTKSDSRLVGGLTGLLTLSQVSLNRSMLAVHFMKYSVCYNTGLIAVDLNHTNLNVQLTVLHSYAEMYNFSGAVGRVSGDTSKLRVRASLNITSTSGQAGFVASFDQGTMEIQLYVTANITSGNCAGIIGNLMGGSVALIAAFGSVKVAGKNSNILVGFWNGGTFNSQECTSPPCSLDPINVSYINLPVIDGVCSPAIASDEPIGSPGNLYFFPCESNIKIKITYSGEIAFGNLAIFNPLFQCGLLGVNLSGTMNIQYKNGFYFGMVKDNRLNATNVYVDLQLTLQGAYMQRVALIACTSYKIFYTDIIMKGKIICNQTLITGYLGGLTAYNAQNITVNRLAVYGLVMEINRITYCGFVAAHQYYDLILSNVIVDDYSKNRKLPDFGDVPQTIPSDFKCAGNIQDAQLQQALRWRNLLINNSPGKRSMLIVETAATNCGLLIGRGDDNIDIYNISIIMQYNITGQQPQQGMMIGYISYISNITSVYFEGISHQKEAGLFGKVTQKLNVTMAVKYTAIGWYSAIFRSYTASAGVFRLAIDIQLNGNSSAGIMYKTSGKVYTIEKIYGTVVKNAGDCYNAYYSTKIDTLTNMYVTNDAVCPEWIE